jgi:hypothetical protein
VPEIGQPDTDEKASSYYVGAMINMVPDDLANLQRLNSFYRQKLSEMSINEIPEELRKNIAQSIAGSQPVFEKIDMGSTLPLPYFDIGIAQGLQVCQTRLARANTATFLISLRTLDLILRNEGDAAVSSIISLLKLTRIFDSHPTLILSAAKAGLIGLACGDIHILLEITKPSEQSLAKLQQVVSEVIPDDVLERMFYAERVYQLQIGRNYFPEDITSQLLPDSAPNLPERIKLSSTFLGRFRIRRKSTAFLGDVTKLLSASRQPWPAPLSAFDNVSQSTIKSSPVISSGIQFIQLNAEIQVQLRSTMLSIMIERYRISHGGKMPESLEMLVPAYCENVPLDPFTGTSLLYSSNEKGYVVYSAYVNRRDDNGSISPKSNEEKPLDMGSSIDINESRNIFDSLKGIIK